MSNWEWGGTLVVHEIYQRADGSLGVKIPEGVGSAFQTKTNLIKYLELSSIDASAESYLCDHTGDLFKFEAEIEFTKETRAFGIRLFEDQATGEAYEFIFNLVENRVTFDHTPNLPWYRYMNKGLERPLWLKAGRAYNLQIIADDTIATLYIDGVALNTRMYAKAGQALAAYVIDGCFSMTNVSLETGLK